MTQTSAVEKVSVEKRRHPRVAVGLPLDISVAGGPCRGTIADMSAGGMTFKTNAELEDGMHVFLKVGAQPLNIRGEVRHTRDGGQGLRRYGVRFHKIDFDAQHRSQENSQ
jgi:c-di-GMP-binding flagellar brake protein YcgR